ncbi:MAG: hypothetical protein ABJ004_10155 [Cyclobacteriaceae bacterium]
MNENKATLTAGFKLSITVSVAADAVLVIPLWKGGFSGSLKRKTGAGQRRLDQSSLPENTRRRHLYSFARCELSITVAIAEDDILLIPLWKGGKGDCYGGIYKFAQCITSPTIAT